MKSGNLSGATNGEALAGRLIQVIYEFRGRLAALTEEKASRIQVMNDLRPPCQVTAFSFRRIRWHVFVITHSRTAPDLQVRVHDVEPWNVFDALEAELEDPLWDDEQRSDGMFQWVTADPNPKLRSVGTSAFLNIQHNSRVWAAADPARECSKHLSGAVIGPQTVMRDFHGDTDEIPWYKFLRDAFSNLDPPPQQAQRPEGSNSAPQTSTGPQYEGRGAFHYPALRIGQLPKPWLRSALVARDALPGIRVLQDRLGPHELIATHNGFFGLLTADSGDALRWLNLLMAALRKRGYPSRPIHEVDLGSFHPPGDDPLHGWGGTWPSRGPGQGEQFAFIDTWLSLADVESCLRLAEELSQKTYADTIPLLLQAESHLTDHEAAQSLIFSWGLIENTITQTWDSFISDRKIHGDRRKGLRSTREWPFQARIEALQMAEELDLNTYNRLVETKKVRNKAMHGSAMPTLTEAKNALALAEHLVIGDDEQVLGPLTRARWDLINDNQVL